MEWSSCLLISLNHFSRLEFVPEIKRLGKAPSGLQFPLGFCTKSGAIPSPQGVLHFRTDGNCSSEMRIGRIVRLGLGKVNRNRKSPERRLGLT
jgi:hypothetical protein